MNMKQDVYNLKVFFFFLDRERFGGVFLLLVFLGFFFLGYVKLKES